MSNRDSSENENEAYLIMADSDCEDHPSQNEADNTDQQSSRKRKASSDTFSEPEVKRNKQGMLDIEHFNCLLNQMNVLTNLLKNNANSVPPTNSNEPSKSDSQESFLQRPAAIIENNLQLNIGKVNTLLKDPKVPSSDPSRVKRLEELQKFNNSNWKEVRYSEVLKTHSAHPGFIELGINDELRQFIKGKDYMAPTERSLAAISNALLSQHEHLKQQLQEFVNWAATPNTELTATSVYEKISELFNVKSKFHKTSEDIMQIVCGKRAECIESRRERILAEIPNKHLRDGLRKIPPSSEFLFDNSALQSYIQSTGGMDKWIRPWFSVDESKRVSQKSFPKAGPSREIPNNRKPFRSDQRQRVAKPDPISTSVKAVNVSKFRKFNRKEGQSNDDKKKFK